MLIHRSLERIRRPSCASGESASSRGGTRVKCLLAVAAGVLACSAALFLLAQAYTAFYLSPVPFPPHEAKQPRANVSPPPLPKSVRESGQGQAAFKEKKTKLPPVQRVTDKIPAESGAIPAAATKQESEAAVLPEQSEQPHSSSSGYLERRGPGGTKLEDRQPVRALDGPDRPARGWRQDQESLDRHFAAQARRNERVLELEQRLRAALNDGDATRSEEALKSLLTLIGADSLGGLKWRGFYALTFGDWNAAARYYGEALARTPGDVQCRFNLALAQLRQGRNEEAALNYRRLKSLAPHSVAVQRLAPYFESR